ncbi:MAG: VTT domain-containing protein [Candidatus Acidiferrales bacterium]
MVKIPKIPGWLTRIVVMLGGGGLFVIAFLDSSVLSFPFVTDLLFMDFVIQRPGRMAYYAVMATLGSLAGCIWLYLLAKKGGEAWRRKRGPKPGGRIRRWVNENAFLSAFVPAILPPPMQFKLFVLAEGIAEVPRSTFVLGILCGRGLRFTVEGLFAMRYGENVEREMLQHKVATLLIPIALITVIYFVSRWLLRPVSTGSSK